jgi:hypothetical protein
MRMKNFRTAREVATGHLWELRISELIGYMPSELKGNICFRSDAPPANEIDCPPLQMNGKVLVVHDYLKVKRK